MCTGGAICHADVVFIFVQKVSFSRLPLLKLENFFSLFLFPLLEGERGEEREGKRDTAETEHKEKQAAAIRLQQEA